jgi:hypothetical protein
MVSLTQINEEVEQKYGPFVIEDVPGGDVTLRNPIRLTENERHRLGELHRSLNQTEQDAPDEDAVVARIREILDLVAVGDGGKRLSEEVGDDAGKLLHVFRLYAEAMQLGEASPSES